MLNPMFVKRSVAAICLVACSGAHAVQPLSADPGVIELNRRMKGVEVAVDTATPAPPPAEITGDKMAVLAWENTSLRQQLIAAKIKLSAADARRHTASDQAKIMGPEYHRLKTQSLQWQNELHGAQQALKRQSRELEELRAKVADVDRSPMVAEVQKHKIRAEALQQDLDLAEDRIRNCAVRNHDLKASTAMSVNDAGAYAEQAQQLANEVHRYQSSRKFIETQEIKRLKLELNTLSHQYKGLMSAVQSGAVCKGAPYPTYTPTVIVTP